ncbi:MAG TPA: aminotransferase class V-fold PLP-dependent enzyme [Acidimicrobiales bacterium]|nr:aminotransferase class V-fold PLP-dependent enzyme [Acidimicrobiales bacterium]
MTHARAEQALLDWPPVTAPDYAAVEDAYRDLVGTRRDLLVVQGEAIVALEAAARGLARPGRRALNLVTSWYGRLFGEWLAAGGAEVVDLAVSFDRAVPPGRVAEQLERGSFDIVSLAHAEAGTGAVNDLPAIAALARHAGALVAVDAVASLGAEPLPIDDLDLDLVVLGAHKALAGPSGATGVVVSERAWEALAGGEAPLRNSALSLLDWRERWLLPGRQALPLIPNHLETRALGAALARAAGEGLDHVVGRHRAAAAASRAALAPLGLSPRVTSDVEGAAVATTIAAPPEGPALLLAACRQASPGLVAPVSVAPGPLAGEALRIDHTGRRATLSEVLVAVVWLAAGLAALGGSPDRAAALEAATAAWSGVLG